MVKSKNSVIAWAGVILAIIALVTVVYFIRMPQLAPEPGCADKETISTVTIGDKVCFDYSASSSKYILGTCAVVDANHRNGIVGSFNLACQTAKDSSSEPSPCDAGCSDQGVKETEAQHLNPKPGSCTITKHRTCSVN